MRGVPAGPATGPRGRSLDAIELYRRMARARALEDALAALWREGRISGEMHSGVGEEGVAVGVAACLRPGDAVALDHRGTPVLCALGVDLALLVKEMLGREDGLNRGRAGHMHLMSPAHLAACSGIVGASAPMGAGFALAARALRPGSVAAAFFGDGAMNQGMLLEALNLASAWTLPLVLVCKDNGWAIFTRSGSVTAGDLGARARAFGLEVAEVDGADVTEVRRAAAAVVERARRGKGPGFLRVRVARPEGHFLGDVVRRAAGEPLGEGRELLARATGGALARGGGGLGARAAAIRHLVGVLWRSRREGRGGRDDPLERARAGLRAGDADAADGAALEEVARAVEAAAGEAGA